MAEISRLRWEQRTFLAPAIGAKTHPAATAAPKPAYTLKPAGMATFIGISTKGICAVVLAVVTGKLKFFNNVDVSATYSFPVNLQLGGDFPVN